jgi:hypothetical protein
MSERTTTLAGLVIHTSDTAVRFRGEDGVAFWVPRSVCSDGAEVEDGDTDLVVADWWLKKEGRL